METFRMSAWYFPGVQGLLAIQRGDVAEAAARLRESLEASRQSWPQMRYIEEQLRRIEGREVAAAQREIERAKQAMFDRLLAESTRSPIH
jgi:hypothetical protein